MGKQIALKKNKFLLFAVQIGVFRLWEYETPTYERRYYFYWPQKLKDNIASKGIGYVSKPKISKSLELDKPSIKPKDQRSKNG